MKICSVGAEFFHAGGRTDGRTDRHDEANSPFLLTRLKHTSALCGQNLEQLNVKPGGGTYDHR